MLEAVQWAVSEESSLEIIGHGSKREIGHPMETDEVLDLSDLTGITLYEPDELVLSAKAGTSMAEIVAAIAAENQELQFEPMDYGPLLGGDPGQGTIGGLLGANLSGPRRIKAGAARDHILGIMAVSGRGEVFKSGGRVVKNVTGYDLSKGLTGSWGTLAVATDVTVKVMPKAETESTVIVRGLLDEAATTVMAVAMGSAAEISGAAHLPEYIASRVLAGRLGKDPATLLRLEGVGPSVDYRLGALVKLLEGVGKIEQLHGDESRALWRDIRDVRPFWDDPLMNIWRLSVPPSKGHEIVFQIRQQTTVEAFFDWQGGLVWLACDDDEAHETIRGVIKSNGGGHATLVRADEMTRLVAPVFQPQPEPLAALSKRLKENFDPKGVLNPGRMVEGCRCRHLLVAYTQAVLMMGLTMKMIIP